MRASLAAVAGLIAATLALAACTGDAPTPSASGPWALEYNAAVRNATSDFERKAFADGVISREEYDEAHELWLLCMEGYFPPGGTKQVVLDRTADGYYQYGAVGFGEDPSEWDAADRACTKGTTESIGWLYRDMASNPEKLSGIELMTQCLVRNGYVPEWYTADNYLADRQADDGGKMISVGEDGVQETSYPGPDNPDLVTGLTSESPGFQECVSDPLH